MRELYTLVSCQVRPDGSAFEATVTSRAFPTPSFPWKRESSGGGGGGQRALILPGVDIGFANAIPTPLREEEASDRGLVLVAWSQSSSLGRSCNRPASAS